MTPVLSRVERLIVNASEGPLNNDTASTRSVRSEEDSTTSATTISPVQHEKQRIDEFHAHASNIKNALALERSAFVVDDQQELEEIDLPQKEQGKLQMLNHFKIPLVPRFLRGLIKDIVKVSSLIPAANLTEYEG